jgi:hypothetical protein
VNLCDPWTRLASAGLVAVLLAEPVTSAALDREHHGERHVHPEITYTRTVDLEYEHGSDLHIHTDIAYVRTVDPSSVVVTGAPLPWRPPSWQPTGGDVQQLTSRLAELAVDEVEADLDPWTIEASSYNIIVSATTRDPYPDEVAAWEGARALWQAILDLGHALTDEGGNEIGAIRRLDADSGVPGWRGKVRMVLKSI